MKQERISLLSFIVKRIYLIVWLFLVKEIKTHWGFVKGNQTARPGQEGAAVPAGCRWSVHAPWFGSSTKSIADAFAHGDKYRENTRLQQWAQAGHAKHEARDKQRLEHRHKKVGLRLMDGGQSKMNPPDSYPSNPTHKAAMKAQKRRRLFLPPPPRHATHPQKPRVTM